MTGMLHDWLPINREKAMQDIECLEVGMTTQIGTNQVDEPEEGREYVRGLDSNSWLLFTEDPAEDRTVVVRIDKIDGDVCHCTVTRKRTR